MYGLNHSSREYDQGLQLFAYKECNTTTRNKLGNCLDVRSKALNLSWKTSHTQKLTFFDIFIFHGEAKTPLEGQGSTKQSKNDLQEKPLGGSILLRLRLKSSINEGRQ